MFGTLFSAPACVSSTAEGASGSTDTQPLKNVCFLVNDDGDRVLRGLTECSKTGLENGALAPVDSDADGRWKEFILRVDNKYFWADITVVSLVDCEAIDRWYEKNPKRPVPALVVNVKPNCDTALKLLAEAERRLSVLNPELKAVVVSGHNDADNYYEGQINLFCDRQLFELIELDPDSDTRETLVNEYREQYGIDRLWELLEVTTWPQRKKKPNPHSRKPRPKNAFDAAHTSDAEDDWPNSEDEAAIVEAFTGPVHDLSKAQIPHRMDPNIVKFLRQQICSDVGPTFPTFPFLPEDILKGFGARIGFEQEQDAKASAEASKVSPQSTATKAEDPAASESKKSKKKKKKSKKKTADVSEDADDALDSETSTLKDTDDQGQDKTVADRTKGLLSGPGPSQAENVTLTTWLQHESAIPAPNPQGREVVGMLGRLKELKAECEGMHPEERIATAGNISLALLQSLAEADEAQLRSASVDDSDGDTIKAE